MGAPGKRALAAEGREGYSDGLTVRFAIAEPEGHYPHRS
jgi:hypothetical protein